MMDAGLAYTLAAVIPVVISFVVVWIFSASMGEGFASSDTYLFVSYLIPQVCLAGVSLFFFRSNQKTLLARSVYRPCKWYYFLLALGLSFGLLSLSELNGYFIQLLEMIGYHLPESTIPPTNGWYLLPALLIIAVLPAVFEETLFRGIQVGSMQQSGWGTCAIVFISGAMFSLFHGNPAQTIYQFICGAIYALLAVRSGSILPTMLAHFANNAVILCLDSAGYSDIPQGIKLPLYIAAGAVLLIVLIYLVFLDKRGNRRGGLRDGKKYFLAALVGILVCAVEWGGALLQGMGII